MPESAYTSCTVDGRLGRGLDRVDRHDHHHYHHHHRMKERNYSRKSRGMAAISRCCNFVAIAGI